ncbi:MAG TPA: Sir2 family NAD-dependent protein deacetylase [Acidobacteriota bacterium]|nr:Sir2 family NAD-dependent protein deacetylase [Acidobacteriota bacterium]
MSDTARLAERLRDARYTLVFTGAGISTASGIPDFRGPKGIWKEMKPVYYDEFLSSHEARVRHWEMKLRSHKEYGGAKPNAGHKALMEFDEMGCLQMLVTQNIDGLHQLAGHDDSKVVEIHGTGRLVECCSCAKTLQPDPFYDEFEKTRQPPVCECGGFLKSATVSFGQPMPEDKLEAAFRAAQQCDLVISVGSTLEVEPAASVPRLAKNRGAYYAIVNKGPTAHDSLADLRLEGDAGDLLGRTAHHLRRATLA